MEIATSSEMNACTDESVAMDGLARMNFSLQSYDGKSRGTAPTMVVIPAPSTVDRAPSPLSCPLSPVQSGPGPRAMSLPLRPSVWDTSGTNWSKSATSLGTNKIRRPYSSISLSSSSDEESSRESVDLEEEHQRALREEQNRTLENTAPLWTGPADGSMRRQMEQIPAATTPMYPRQRSVTDTSDTPFGTESNGGTNHFPRSSDSNNLRPFRSASGFLIRNQRNVTAHSRRSLLILFLVAVYVTVGLTTPSIPEERDLIFPDNVAPVVEVLELHDSPPVLATTDTPGAELKLRSVSSSEASSVRHASVGKSKLSFVRGNKRQMLAFRKKEITDFYHQKALQDETSNLSWYYYANCFVLVAIALWAWRERSIAARAASGTDQSQQQRVSLLM